MKRLTGHLYFWVLLAIVGGGIFGYVNPPAAVKLKPLGDGFIALVKMLISPVIFCTVVLGIAGAGDMKKVGDRKSTRLNSSHGYISYAVFCLKKKKNRRKPDDPCRQPSPKHAR